MLVEPHNIPGIHHTVKVMSDRQDTIFEIKKETILVQVEPATFRRLWRNATVELRTMVGGQCCPQYLIGLAQQAHKEQEKLDTLYPTGEPALT